MLLLRAQKNLLLALSLLTLIGTTSFLWRIREETVGNEMHYEPTSYAVFSASTPDGETHRGFDYAFYLPLTALAWERIGFKSIVLIAGRRCEWDRDPALRLILDRLEIDRQASVIFINAATENRVMIGQTSRIFAVNFPGFPGRPRDYIITSDADLWPIHRDHYIPRSGHDLVLVHSECCGPFSVSWRTNKSFTMYPMANIGASVSTWREIMSRKPLSLASDSSSILNYFEEEGFGPGVKGKVPFASDGWFLDQQMVSIRIQDWMDAKLLSTGKNATVYRVSDKGFSRIDRIDWQVDRMHAKDLETRYDAHMVVKPFLPKHWNKKVRPLVDMMYGGPESLQTRWCQDYAERFQDSVKAYLHFSQHDEFDYHLTET